MYKKKSKIPLNQGISFSSEVKKKDKHTMANCYSITVRPGNGFFLGSKAVALILDYLEKDAKYFVLAQEMIEENSHLQGGVFYANPKRQDKIREGLVPLVRQLWLENNGDKPYSDYYLEKVKKHAIEVRPHTNWDVLTKYCCKGLCEYDDNKVSFILRYQNYISLPLMKEWSGRRATYSIWLEEIKNKHRAKHGFKKGINCEDKIQQFMTLWDKENNPRV